MIMIKPLSLPSLKRDHGLTFEVFDNENLDSLTGYARGNKPIVFVGITKRFDLGSVTKLYDVMDEIDKNETKKAAEELGFEGYKFTYYIMGEDMRFDRLGKNDIQKLRLKKL